MLEKLTLSKMSQMSRAMKSNSESLTLTEMRVQNYSMTRCNETRVAREERKADPTGQTNCSKGLPTIAGRGHAGIIPVSTGRFMTNFLNNAYLIQCPPFNAVISFYFSYFSSQDKIWI